MNALLGVLVLISDPYFTSAAFEIGRASITRANFWLRKQF